MNSMKSNAGFTIVEILIAIVVLTVGILGMVTTSALVTRMIARGQRTAVAAQFAAQRFERLRVTGCANRVAGADTLKRGSNWVSINTWAFTDIGNQTFRIVLTNQFKTQQNKIRTQTLETSISCLV
jgi:prepilin-type N-terminal cleavage/methylation domain-containing protein